MGREVPSSDVEQAIRELTAVRRDWLGRPGVTGVDVGYKIRGDRLTEELSIRVHVRRKLPLDALAPHDAIVENLGTFPTDVIEAEYEPSNPTEPAVLDGLDDIDRMSRLDPLVGGISVGTPETLPGTLATIVWDRRDGSVNLLSNWHILAGRPAAEPGEPIFQPAPVDGGSELDIVATLNRSRLDTDMDAAIARLNGARGYSRDIIGLTGPISGIAQATLGMHVVKSGRTTDVTAGIVDGIDFSGPMTYEHGRHTLTGQIHIVPRPPWPAQDAETSAGGDSGSLWIAEATGKAVGLHYAGETNPAPRSEHALANPIGKVAAATGLDFSFTPVFLRHLGRRMDRDDAPATVGAPLASQDRELDLEAELAHMDTVIRHVTNIRNRLATELSRRRRD